MLYEFTLQTKAQDFHNVTARVREAIKKSGFSDGACLVYCPHTMAGLTIN